ncbi:capsid triplex subunit 1 [Falconid herpesvirus 1]|uniref:Capsid triplex subunit 1 n=2 Tax=Columbid alphaherpesvirus 1 TaxID=93386 RepID=A0A068ER37_9ALPH|nr:capsid triplex subunit 1 [Falconid herpesvirus 1]YP_009352946.1 capsid triplex subunit 1 [Columbid alphaherpesvirus 1]AID52742.1 capsid triplex subunit 1 [Falconid herpesvirus 1]ARD71363.1 capsid triplex subunit 1 [Columbid alphaherpesvirus 1]
MKVPVEADNGRRSAYAMVDPLRGVFRAVSDPIAAGMNRRFAMGYPTACPGRSGLAEGVSMLRTIGLPGPTTLHLGRNDANDDVRVTSALVNTLVPGRGGLLDLGDAAAGAEQTFLSRQVSLTDFCRPDVERLGSVILSIRHPLDVNSTAVYSTPAGRDHRALEAVWYELSEVASVAVNRLDHGGVRPSLVALSFLVAARSSEYSDRAGAEAIRTHIVSNYGSRQVGERLDRFSACLLTMIRNRVFPHRMFGVLGGLLSCVAQREIASITAVVRGPQEGVKTEMTDMPRSTVNVPACAFIDLDKDLKLLKDDSGAANVYLVFVYTQRLEREGMRAYVVYSRLNEHVIGEGLGHLLARLRASNAITGMQGANVPAPNPDSVFPMLRLYADRNAYRCPPARLLSPAATERLPVWTPDLRGRVSPDSCMYAAYCRLGHVNDLSRVHRRSDRYGSVDVPTVWIEGLVWAIGEWRECYY